MTLILSPPIISSYPLVRPFLKPKGFCAAPIPKWGIPAYADSSVNKSVIGTPAWREYWEEQVYYCINGYTTAGVFIPGRYYHFLNFCKTSSVKGGGAFYPEYVDYQYEFFLLVEEAKRLRKNIIAPKGRRKGVSVVMSGIIDHGYRFLPNYHAGIAAGKKEYSEDFLDKWLYIDSLMCPEFKVRKLSKTYDDIIAGWEQKGEDGDWTDMGTKNSIYVRTMFKDPEVFKGKYLNDVVYEESGEFDNLIKTHQATKACVMDGNIQYGTEFWYGTGGNIKSGSKGFEEVWHNYEHFNALRYFISGTKYFRPCVAGSTDGSGNLIEDVPNISHIPDYQRVGMEDEKRALQIIEQEKKILLKSKNMTNYWEYCKDNPIDIKEVFRRAASNDFPVEVLNNQMYDILSQDKRYGKYRLEYKIENNQIVLPRQVIAIPAKEDDDENECVMILHTGHPRGGYRNLDVAGIDSYDLDKSLTSKSLGSMVVLRRNHNINDIDKMTPVLLIRCRPARKEKFYEMCMKSAIYYDLKYNTLGDVRTPGIIQYFKEAGCEIYLAKRPKKFESENSEQQHEYWVSLNSYSKPIMVSLLQSYLIDHGRTIWFPQILEEALNYDVLEKDSDNDSVDALGIALMQHMSNGMEVYDEARLQKHDPYAYPEYDEDAEGNIVMKGKLKEEYMKHGDPDLRALELKMMNEQMNDENYEVEDNFE